MNPIVFRDGDAAAPDPVTGLNIPDFKKEAEGEVAAARVAMKAGLFAGKCYAKAVKYTLEFGASLPPEVLAKIEACLDRAQSLSDEGMAELDQRQKLPSCLPLGTAQGLGTTAVDVAGQFTDEIYCASPSGAFLN